MDCTIIDCMVAMRDGTPLRTLVYLPKIGARYPVVLVRNPYSAKNTIPVPNEEYLQKGMVAVLQDCRGTGRSEGLFYPWHAEVDDGADCLKWVAAQPWCNGRIAMIGGSYQGAAQWYAAFSAHPDLVGITIRLAPYDCHESPHYIGGAFCLMLSVHWGISNHYRNGGYAKMDFDWEKLDWHLPLKDIPEFAGLSSINFWNDWIAHSDDGAYWDKIKLIKHVHNIMVPAYLGGGWFDLYARGMLDSFTAMRQRAGTEKARRYTRCIIGPWQHGGASEGEIDYGEQSKRDIMDGNRNLFLENILKNPEDDPLPGVPPLLYFVMGSNEWRSADAWPVPGVNYVDYFLHSGGRANSRFGDGTLKLMAPGKSATDVYVYDPRNPVPTKGGCNVGLYAGAVDQAQIEARADVLVFSSDILGQDLFVVGPVRLVLFAASDAPDTDFTAKLVDVYPDGRAMNVCDGIIRARYRQSTSKQVLLENGRIYEYKIDCWDTANCFKAGHQIRVEISSSNFPRFDRNPNTGRKFGEDDELHIARQTIYHDCEHPSRLVLPVLTS